MPHPANCGLDLFRFRFSNFDFRGVIGKGLCWLTGDFGHVSMLRAAAIWRLAETNSMTRFSRG